MSSMNRKMIKIIPVLAISLGLFACSEAAKEPEITEDNTENTTQNEAPLVQLKNTTKPVFFDFTSTGCPGCGSWGKPSFNSIISDFEDDIVPMAIHIKYGDKMITPVSEAIGSNRTGQFYTPQLWVNNSNGMQLSAGRINSTGSVDRIKGLIETFKTETPDIQVGVTESINDKELSVRVKTKANEDLDGEYFLGVYVMENGLSYNQSSSPANPTIHDHVIRTSNNGGFGNTLSSESLVANSEFDDVLTFNLEDDWNKENVYVTAIIWKKNGSIYTVVNADNNFTKE